MLILFWNVRGLDLPSKKCLAKETINKGDTAIVCLQEAKLSHYSPSILRSICGKNYQGHHALEAVRSTGDLLTVWNLNETEGRPFHRGRFSLSTEFSLRNSASKFIITNIYGPHDLLSHAEFFLKLHDLNRSIIMPWALIGDFNVTTFNSDRSSATKGTRSSQAFNDFIFMQGLLEINLTSRRFTWSNFRE
ncbi:uncharacterized protein [Elaeis guineensis]|uniref:uncharacterized protein n=1 Tax=Elaeis guineensis var. tenera TaxID=51953 RepID=UPI003C6CD1EA